MTMFLYVIPSTTVQRTPRVHPTVPEGYDLDDLWVMCNPLAPSSLTDRGVCTLNV